MKNRHGLPRNIPADVRRLIRQKSKFSCVVCRAPFCTYEHFDPPFKDARVHDPEGICLLCPSCQADTTAGRLSKEVVLSLYHARQDETAVQSTKSNFMYFSKMPQIRLGESSVVSADTVVCTDEIDCLSVQVDPQTGLLLINMRVFDKEGQQVCEIVENTWSSDYQPWDFEYAGKVATFRSRAGRIIFRAEFDSENAVVHITHLNMALENSFLRIENGDIVAGRNSRDGKRTAEIKVRFHGLAARAAIFLDNRQDVPPVVSSIPVLHNSYCGITIGRGGNCCIQRFELNSRGVLHTPADQAAETVGPKEAYVRGQLAIVTIAYPFWEEKEYYLNGIKLSNPPYSVDDDEECELGGKTEIFHLGAPDAGRFDKATGLIGHSEAELERPPKRPHRFL